MTITCRIKLSLEGEMAKGVELHWFMSSNQWFGYMGESFKGAGSKKWWQRVLRKREGGELVRRSTECRDICVPRDSLPKGIYCRGWSSNQVEKIIPSRQVSVFAQLRSACKRAAEQCGQDMDWHYTSAQQYNLCWLLPLPNAPPAEIRDGNRVHNMTWVHKELARYPVTVPFHWRVSSLSSLKQSESIHPSQLYFSDLDLSSLSLMPCWTVITEPTECLNYCHHTAST